MGALSHTKPAAGMNVVSVFAFALSLTLFHRRVFKCKPSTSKQALHLLKYFLTHGRVLVLKYWQFYFKYCLSFLAENICLHELCLSFSAQIIITQIKIDDLGHHSL